MDRGSFYFPAQLRRLIVLAVATSALWGGHAHASAGPSCSATSGGLTLRAKAVRTAGVSPVLIFFDATGTTSSAATGSETAFKDVSYSWNFGDLGVSGSGTWAHGSDAGHLSKNSAAGAVAAHLYLASGADATRAVTVTAHDGVSTASCQIGVTVYNASGANGFPGAETTCVYNTTLGSGCPAGARTLHTYSLNTALGSTFGSSRRVLFRCGDRFSGSYSIGSGVTKASIGAYGGCESTTANRPVFQNSSGTTLSFSPHTPTDIRVADIDFEDGSGGAQAIGNGGGLGQMQITLYNLNCNGMNACYYMNQATQSGIVASTADGMRNATGTFWNYAENNCLNGSSAANCGGSPVYYSVNYNALLGSSFNGQGAPNNGSGIETVRISACRLCVIANNTFKNANNVGAVLKLHSGNTWMSQRTWIGQYTEYVEIADNLFTGTSGAQLIELAPQNGNYDERIRNVVFEGNFIQATGASKTLVSAVSVALRNNVFYVNRSDGKLSDYSMQVSRRGIEPIASAVEVYNNTCYALTTQSGCVGFISGDGTVAAGINSQAKNNMFFDNGSGNPAVVNYGSGNTVSANTANSAANPLVINASGIFSLISDFEPTQHYSGGVNVPVWYDALGSARGTSWSLGALKP